MTRTRQATETIAWTDEDLQGDPHAAPDKATRIRRMFTAIAPNYDLNNSVHSLGLDQRWRRRTVALARIQPGDHVLDVACGTGDLTEALSLAGPASVTGIDFTEAMLDIARTKTLEVRRSPVASTPTYEHGDATALSQVDDSIDVITIAFGLRNVVDPALALREFKRVLRPRGRLLVLELGEPANPMLRALHHLYGTRIMPFTAALLARDRSGAYRSAYRYLPRSIETFTHQRDLPRHLLEAGFAAVVQHPMSFGACVCTRAEVPARA